MGDLEIKIGIEKPFALARQRGPPCGGTSISLNGDAPRRRPDSRFRNSGERTVLCLRNSSWQLHYAGRPGRCRPSDLTAIAERRPGREESNQAGGTPVIGQDCPGQARGPVEDADQPRRPLSGPGRVPSRSTRSSCEQQRQQLERMSAIERTSSRFKG